MFFICPPFESSREVEFLSTSSYNIHLLIYASVIHINWARFARVRKLFLAGVCSILYKFINFPFASSVGSVTRQIYRAVITTRSSSSQVINYRRNPL